MPTKLSSSNIQTSLKQLHVDWSLNADSGSITRKFEFHDFYQTMAFANSVAWIAHQHDHHPDMLITYKTCQIEFFTHSVKALTGLDFTCAKAIDNLLIS